MRYFEPGLLDLVDRVEHEEINDFLNPKPTKDYPVYVGYKLLIPIYPVQPLKKYSKEEIKALEEKMRREGKL